MPVTAGGEAARLPARLLVHRPRAVQSAVVALGFAAVALATVASVPGAGPGVVAVRLAGVVLPVAVGIVCLTHRRTDAFALLLIAAGVLSSVTTLAESSASVAYSVGRLAVWPVEWVLVVLILAFPEGRLHGRHERWLVAAAAALVVLLWIPRRSSRPIRSPRRGRAAASAVPPTPFSSPPARRASWTMWCGLCARRSPSCCSRP